jgi:hypothetical protein
MLRSTAPPRFFAAGFALGCSLCALPNAAYAQEHQRLVRSSADLPIRASDVVINLNCAAPLSIRIPLASSRHGKPLILKDVGGKAGTNNITLNATAPDTFDSLIWFKLTTNYQSITLAPANDGATKGWSLR